MLQPGFAAEGGGHRTGRQIQQTPPSTLDSHHGEWDSHSLKYMELYHSKYAIVILKIPINTVRNAEMEQDKHPGVNK